MIRHTWAPEMTNELAILAGYVYKSTDKIPTEDKPLRCLVSSIIAIAYHDLDETVMKNLMAEGGDCFIDIVVKSRQILWEHCKGP